MRAGGGGVGGGGEWGEGCLFVKFRMHILSLKGADVVSDSLSFLSP